MPSKIDGRLVRAIRSDAMAAIAVARRPHTRREAAVKALRLLEIGGYCGREVDEFAQMVIDARVPLD